MSLFLSFNIGPNKEKHWKKPNNIHLVITLCCAITVVNFYKSNNISLIFYKVYYVLFLFLLFLSHHVVKYVSSDIKNWRLCHDLSLCFLYPQKLFLVVLP